MKHCSPLTKEQINSARNNQYQFRVRRDINVVLFSCFSFFDQVHIAAHQIEELSLDNILICDIYMNSVKNSLINKDSKKIW